MFVAIHITKEITDVDAGQDLFELVSEKLEDIPDIKILADTHDNHKLELPPS